MSTFIEVIKAIILGIVEGVTEWLPVSSTGHMILVDEFLKLNSSDAFKDMFLVVIQLGAIMAVVVLYWNNIMPLGIKRKNDGAAEGLYWKKDTLIMWLKILVACVPAGVVGLLWDDVFTRLFYNYQTVAVMLILFGILFIIIENWNKHKVSTVNDVSQITYWSAFLIGVFQLIAAVFPGTSRSGATIVGALLLGLSRTVAAEFTFYLAIPAMFGASVLKIAKFGLAFTGTEILVLIVGLVVAFVVSMLTIKFLMGYIKKHDFKVFGWYRIILGVIVLLYFWFLAS
ncbi:MAG TPA: undecaprenyl-diphosphate phosphatase [Firmicutes bacterium]|nr:undecaprenyl-diphosphate phosphatase [Bacillota bacterium]